MHLWPSMRIRDSFKLDYLKKLEWNLHRMKSEKNSSTSSSTDQKLLDNGKGVVKEEGAGTSPSSKAHNGVLLLSKEILMVLSCCYCCFCCGVWVSLSVNLDGLQGEGLTDKMRIWLWGRRISQRVLKRLREFIWPEEFKKMPRGTAYSEAGSHFSLQRMNKTRSMFSMMSI
ncbi:hypothetical protein FNV43_RR25034 [Rhamnella rubrinervis]|uniref:Uncharacterized protein n=1 Tax=Rhamnella rubrinervis TaxID=2594499 RepID=A0A8K0GQT0_9ROSA|nr:hypothetical protein FNV43_RR25034 [Rhamnella rubrinervis]